jgi:CheY-like chemotaxis protein
MEYNSLKDCSILVVDDEVELCELVVEEFKKTGAQVTMATSGFEGIQRVLNKNFDIVFTDIRMSNGDGYFLAKEIQKLNLTNLFVFFYSGHCELTLEELKTLNVSGVFKKPQSFRIILQTLDKFIAEKRR